MARGGRASGISPSGSFAAPFLNIRVRATTCARGGLGLGPGVRLRRPDQSLIVGAYPLPIVHPSRRIHTLCMGKLVTFGVALCLASSTLAQPRDYLTSRPWIDQQREQSRKKQLDLQRRQRAEQQQQLNQERFRAEHGWQLHPRPQAPWEERSREDELRKEFPAQR